MNIFEKVKESVCDYVHEKRNEVVPCKNHVERCFHLIRVCDLMRILDQVEKEVGISEMKNGWIPAYEPPKNDKYILISFANFSLPVIGRYEEDEEGGAYYAGDEDVSLVSQEMIVNAWRPLPAPYRPDDAAVVVTNGDRIRTLTDEELAEKMMTLDLGEAPWCVTNNVKCNEILDRGETLSPSMCKQCCMAWLQKEEK